jgi:serine/threonine protein kinase
MTVCTWERGRVFQFRGDYQELISFLRQLLWSLAQLHRAGFFSRDVKPSNVLWDRRTWGLTLIDFDLAAEVGGLHTARLGTDGYMAPEVESRAPYGRNCDVWSAAVCTLGFLLCIPERDVLDHPPAAMLLRAERLPSVPRELIALLGRMLDPDPSTRPQAEHLLTDRAFFSSTTFL